MQPTARGEFADQPFDPYSPPVNKPTTEWRGPRAGIVDFNASDVMGAAWTLFKERMGLCIGACLLAFGLNYMLGFGQGYFIERNFGAGTDATTRTVVQVVTMIAVYLIATWFNIGLQLVLLGVARRESNVFERLFAGAPYLIRVILALLIFFLVFFGLAIVMAVIFPILARLSGQRDGAIMLVPMLGMVFLLPLILYISLRLCMFMLMIIDRDAGPMESLNLSWQATQSKVISLLVIFLAMGAVNLLGAICFVVGLLITIPYTSLVFVVAYLALTHQPVGRSKSTKRSPYDAGDPAFDDFS